MNNRLNILETVLNYDTYKRVDGIDLSPSEVGGKSKYQIWLKNSGVPETHEISTELKVNSFVGTAFHNRAEEAIKAKYPEVYTEIELKGKIGNATVGGVADVIYECYDTYIVGDYKTLGVYQFKKAFRNNFKDYITQLSIYSYLYAQNMSVPYSKYGEVYIVVTGDAGYFRKDEGGGKTPKYITETIELLDEDEVVKLVDETMEAIKTEPEMDCESWAGPYCKLECIFRGPGCGC